MDIQTFLFLMRSHVRVGLAITEKPAGGNAGCGTEKIPRSGLRVNSTPFVRQYDILSNKWGVLLCQKEYQTNDIRRNSREWL